MKTGSQRHAEDVERCRLGQSSGSRVLIVTVVGNFAATGTEESLAGNEARNGTASQPVGGEPAIHPRGRNGLTRD